jgi:hypothetical protein
VSRGRVWHDSSNNSDGVEVKRASIAGIVVACCLAGDIRTSSAAPSGTLSADQVGQLDAAVSQASLAQSIAASAALQAAAALPMNGSKPMAGPLTTQQVNLGQGYSIVGWNGGVGSVGWTGSDGRASNGGAIGKSAFILQPYMYGAGNSIDLLHIQPIDGVQDVSSGGGTIVHVSDYIDNYAVGNRNVGEFDAFISKTPAYGNAYAAVEAQVQVNAPLPTRYGTDGVPLSFGGDQPQVAPLYGYTRVASPGAYEVNGTEIDNLTTQGVGVGEMIAGTMITGVDDPSGCSTAFIGTCYPGLYENDGWSVEGQTKIAYAISKTTGDWIQPADSTLFGVNIKSYGGPITRPVTAWQGVDLRGVTFGQAAFSSRGFGVSGTGQVSANGLITSGTVQAVSASLSAITVHVPGTYTSWPDLTVEAPASGGIQAMAAVAAMQANAVTAFGSTGQGYRVGDVLTPPASTGFAGRLFTLTVGSVDASGGITGFSGSDPGAMTSIPGGINVVSLSGGSGSGATVYMTWLNGVAAGTFTATFDHLAATGSNYRVGDTVRIQGDVGAAATLIVTKVTQKGGIMFDNELTPHSGMKVASAGAVTVIGGSGGFHKLAGGSGEGASVTVGYGVKAVKITDPGSHYTIQPLPRVVPSQSGFGNAELIAVMAASDEVTVLGNSKGVALPGGLSRFDQSSRHSVAHVVVGSDHLLDASPVVLTRDQETENQMNGLATALSTAWGSYNESSGLDIRAEISCHDHGNAWWTGELDAFLFKSRGTAWALKQVSTIVRNSGGNGAGYVPTVAIGRYGPRISITSSKRSSAKVNCTADVTLLEGL